MSSHYDEMANAIRNETNIGKVKAILASIRKSQTDPYPDDDEGGDLAVACLEELAQRRVELLRSFPPPNPADYDSPVKFVMAIREWERSLALSTFVKPLPLDQEIGG